MRHRRLKARIFEQFGSQADFAAAMGIDESLVSRVIHGRRKLSGEERDLWCRVLQCRPEVFQEAAE